MKTININIHRRLRFAAAILTAGYFTAAGSVQAGDDVPLKGHLAGVNQITERDGTGYPLETETVLVGEMSHLGEEATAVIVTILADVKFDGREEGEFEPSDIGKEFDVEFESTATYTAANGDVIYVELTQTGTVLIVFVDQLGRPYYLFPDQTILSLGVITGGTGRFEGAEGTLDSLVEMTDYILVESWSEGTISTVSSRGGNGEK